MGVITSIAVNARPSLAVKVRSFIAIKHPYDFLTRKAHSYVHLQPSAIDPALSILGLQLEPANWSLQTGALPPPSLPSSPFTHSHKCINPFAPASSYPWAAHLPLQQFYLCAFESKEAGGETCCTLAQR